jgi:hypothetical protein
MNRFHALALRQHRHKYDRQYQHFFHGADSSVPGNGR